MYVVKGQSDAGFDGGRAACPRPQARGARPARSHGTRSRSRHREPPSAGLGSGARLPAGQPAAGGISTAQDRPPGQAGAWRPGPLGAESLWGLSAAAMMDALPFPVGRPPSRAGPLSRFLPPLEAGSARRALPLCEPRDAWLLDPFGASPRLVVELAACGASVLTACNNPVTRFVLEGAARPSRRPTCARRWRAWRRRPRTTSAWNASCWTCT